RGERSEAEADIGSERRRHRLAWIGAVRLGRRIMKRARRAKQVEVGDLAAELILDGEELAKGGAMVLPRPRRRRYRRFERRARLVHPAEQQQGLRFGGGAPIRRLGLLGLARDPLQHLARNLLGLVAVAGE